MSNPTYAVFRFVKLKNKEDIARVGKHDSRDKKKLPENVDPKRVNNNLLLKGSGDSIKEFEEIEKGVKRRSDSVLGYDAVCTFSNACSLNKNELDKWCKKSIRWLENTFGKDNVINVWLHMDEDTPHLHSFIVPIVIAPDGSKKFNAKEFTGGTVKCQQLQTSYYNAVKDLGLSRGIEGSRAKHLSAKEYKKRSEAIRNRLEKMDSKTMQKEYINALIRVEQLEAERKAFVDKIGGLENRLKSSENDLSKAYDKQQASNKKIAYYEQKLDIMRNINPLIEKEAEAYIKMIPSFVNFIKSLPENQRKKASIIDFDKMKNTDEAMLKIANTIHPLPDRIKYSHEKGFKQIKDCAIKKPEIISFLHEDKAYTHNFNQMNFSISGIMCGVALLFIEGARERNIEPNREVYKFNVIKNLEELGYTQEEIEEYLNGNEDALKRKKSTYME